MTEQSTKERGAESSTAAAAPATGSANTWIKADQASADWWYQLDQRIHDCIRMWVEGTWWEKQHDALEQRDHELREAVGEVFGQHRATVREAYTRLKERVVRLEAAGDLQKRFDQLARETVIPQSELLKKIDELQRQLNELKEIAAQPGPQGPPGKLPCVREYAAEHVHYEAGVVTHNGGLWQALADTVHAPPHDDWICLARSGRDGITPTIRGTFDAYTKYKKLDIVAMDGASFVAKYDNPGVCPGDGWQLMSKQGKQGRKGESILGPRGAKGDKGDPAPTLRSWLLDSENYRISPLMSDGTVGPMMELRGMFEQFLHEVGWPNEATK